MDELFLTLLDYVGTPAILIFLVARELFTAQRRRHEESQGRSMAGLYERLVQIETRLDLHETRQTQASESHKSLQRIETQLAWFIHHYTAPQSQPEKWPLLAKEKKDL